MEISLLVGLLSCCWITYEDLKSRYIHILPLLLLGVSGAVNMYASYHENWQVFLLLNLGGVVFLLLSVGLIYWWKGEKNLLDTKLGLGDIIMFVSLGCWFIPEKFWPFFSLNICLWALVFGLLQLSKSLPKEYPIPLAGLLAIGFILYQVGVMIIT